jgi:hypothetical protein
MNKVTKVLEMSEDLFVQRKRVMGMLYEAREVLGMDLPRIKVRIAEFESRKGETVLGRCFLNQDYITISKDMTKWTDELLRLVVWHELAHAFFNAAHDLKCPLMHPSSPNIKPLRADLVKAFKRLARKSKTSEFTQIAYVKGPFIAGAI